ncbi:hypothetical protein V6N13_100124 [Hibiscus sabdariffa]
MFLLVGGCGDVVLTLPNAGRKLIASCLFVSFSSKEEISSTNLKCRIKRRMDMVVSSQCISEELLERRKWENKKEIHFLLQLVMLGATSPLSH